MAKLLLDEPLSKTSASYIGHSLSSFAGRDDNPTQPEDVVFGDSDVFSKFKPNWGYKPEYSNWHKVQVATKQTTDVPVILSGSLSSHDFKDSVAYNEYLDEAEARGYLVDRYYDYIDPLSMHKLSDLEYEKLDPKSDLNTNPDQGRFGGVPNYTETPGENSATDVHKSMLQRMFDKGEYTTDFNEALDKALAGIPQTDLVYRGARPEGYRTGREAVSIEQQAEIPGAVGGKKGERLYSVTLRDPSYSKAYIEDKGLGTLYAGYASDIKKYYNDADTDYIGAASSILAHDVKKLTPIIHAAKLEQDDGSIVPVYFPVQNNKLVQRLMAANKEYDEYEQLTLFDPAEFD